MLSWAYELGLCEKAPVMASFCLQNDRLYNEIILTNKTNSGIIQS